MFEKEDVQQVTRLIPRLPLSAHCGHKPAANPRHLLAEAPAKASQASGHRVCKVQWLPLTHHSVSSFHAQVPCSIPVRQCRAQSSSFKSNRPTPKSNHPNSMLKPSQSVPCSQSPTSQSIPCFNPIPSPLHAGCKPAAPEGSQLRRALRVVGVGMCVCERRRCVQACPAGKTCS